MKLVNRRYFLQGMSGSLMALPFLPSLLTKAEAAEVANEKYLVLFGSGHGGTGEADWYPKPVVTDLTASVLRTETLLPFSAADNVQHIIRHGRLQDMVTSDITHAGGNVDNGQSRVSFILGSFLNPYISKMNLYRGIDGGTFYSGHSSGMYGGNLKRASNGSTEGMEHWPTIDQFLGASSKFYSDPSAISLKVISNSNSFSNLPNGTTLPATASAIDRMFTAIFQKFEASTDPQVLSRRLKKEYLIDRVYEDYKRFLTGAHGPARTISAVDKLRVEQHIQDLSEVQLKHQQLVNSCSDVSGPKDRISFSSYAAALDLYLDLIASAFSCGASRIAVIHMPHDRILYQGDYHQDIAHNGGDPARALIHKQTFRWHAERGVSKMVQKLNAISPTGMTGSILDNGLVLWTHECGFSTHHHNSIGLVSFGSLGGHFKTGNYVDYRNFNVETIRNTSNRHPGVPIQRFWANIIQGFGFSKSEYERSSNGGYSDSNLNTWPKSYPQRLMTSLSDRLPIIT